MNTAVTHWPSVGLGEVAELCLGKMLDAKKNKGRLLPYLANPNVRWLDVDTSTLKLMPFEEHEDERYGLRAGDVVICEGGEAGRAAVWDGRVPGMKFQKAIHRVRPSPSLDARFLVYRLMFDYQTGRLADYYTGATIKHLTGQDLARYRFPLPPLSEQRRIAAVLDKVDGLRAARRQALAQLDQLAQSTFVEMFGDPGANPKGWPLVALGRLIREKPNNGIFRKNEEYGDGLPVAWVEELFRGHSVDLDSSRRLRATQEEVRKYGLKRGDILFCRSSLKLAGLGYNNVYLGPDDAALFECHVIRISPRPDVADSEFLNFLLRIPSQRQRLFRFAKTVTMSTIDQEGIKNIEVPVPPRELQKLFVERLHAIQRNGTQMRDSARTLDKLFESLQQQVFGGSCEMQNRTSLFALGNLSGRPVPTETF